MAASFLQELARARPDPGGGAAAAYGAVLALALVEKVLLLELGRSQPMTRRRFWEELLSRVRHLSGRLAQLQGEDVRAYAQLSRARVAGEAEALPAALKEAVSCPGRIIQQVHQALKLLSQVAGHCRKHLVADLLVACEFLGAALQGAHHIASANLPLVGDPEQRQILARELARDAKPAWERFQTVRVELVVREHGLDPGG